MNIDTESILNNITPKNILKRTTTTTINGIPLIAIGCLTLSTIVLGIMIPLTTIENDDQDSVTEQNSIINGESKNTGSFELSNNSTDKDNEASEFNMLNVAEPNSSLDNNTEEDKPVESDTLNLNQSDRLNDNNNNEDPLDKDDDTLEKMDVTDFPKNQGGRKTRTKKRYKTIRKNDRSKK